MFLILASRLKIVFKQNEKEYYIKMFFFYLIVEA